MSTNALAVTGTVTNTGTVKTSSTSATAIPSGKTWGGTMEYSATSGLQTIAGGTFNNLTFDNTSGTNTAGGSIIANGALTTTAGGTLNMGAYDLGGSGTFTNSGTIKTSSTSGTPIPSGKTWAGTVEYGAATGSQTIVGGTFNNLTLDNSGGTNTAGGNITVNTGTFSTTSGGILDMGSANILAGSGTFTNNGTIKTSVPTSTSSAPIPEGRTWSGTVEYGAVAGAQTVVAGTYNNLELYNTSGTNTLSGPVIVNGSFGGSGGAMSTSNDVTFNGTTTCGETINASAGTVTYGSSAVNILAGTYYNLTISGSSVVFCGPVTVINALTFTGTINLTNNLTLQGNVVCGSSTVNASAGVVEYTSTLGGQNIMSGTYYGLKLDSQSGINTACGNLTVNGTLTSAAGGTLDMVSYQILGTLSASANNGTIRTQNTSVTPIPTGKTWGGTVEYNGTLAQTVVAGTFNNIVFSGSTTTQKTNYRRFNLMILREKENL